MFVVAIVVVVNVVAAGVVAVGVDVAVDATGVVCVVAVLVDCSDFVCSCCV